MGLALPSWLKTSLLCLVATIASLLAAEWIARLALPPSWEPTNVARFGDLTGPTPWPGLPHRLIPGAVQLKGFRGDPRGYLDRHASLTYRINSLGFRGPETTWEKPAHHLRVVGLGDSFTFGWGVRTEDTFLAVLEERLRSTPGAPPIEVLNLGVMGYSTMHEVALLRHLGLRLSPDTVVICFFLNDATDLSTARLFNLREVRHSWWRRSRLLDQLVLQIERPGRVRQLIDRYHQSYKPYAKRWLSAQDGMQRAVALSKAHGFDLVLMIFPVLWELSDYPFREIHETVRAAAEARGIPVLDLAPVFAGHRGPELWVNSTDQHPNEIAHAIAGEALHEFLLERGLPRPREARSP